jgi:hypothetical protein
MFAAGLVAERKRAALENDVRAVNKPPAKSGV